MKKLLIVLVAASALGMRAYAVEPLQPNVANEITSDSAATPSDTLVEPPHGGHPGGGHGGGHPGGGHPGGGHGGGHPAPAPHHPAPGYPHHPAPAPHHPAPGYPHHPAPAPHHPAPGYPHHPAPHPHPGHPHHPPGYHPPGYHPHPMPPYYPRWTYQCQAQDEFGRIYTVRGAYDPRRLQDEVVSSCEYQSGGYCVELGCARYY